MTGAVSHGIGQIADSFELNFAHFSTNVQLNVFLDATFQGIIGGITSEATGGRFADGFYNSALTRLLNDIAHSDKWVDGATAKRIEIGIKELEEKLKTSATEPNQVSNLRETPEQRELRINGDVIGYYEARLAAGDTYAETALKVVRNECYSKDSCGLSMANVWLFIKAGREYQFVDLFDVQVDLMNAHADWVKDDKNGILGLLNPEQVAKYHHEVFEKMGLPASTFGGTPLGGWLWEINYTSWLWCKACDIE